jgi:hypothetical protein
MPGMDRQFSTWASVVSTLAGSLAMAGGLAITGSLVFLGCATTVQEGGNLRVKVLDATSDRPSNVALHLSVDGKNGQPIEGLKPANFRIFEDGKLVPEDKAKRMLLDPKEAEVHITLLLVDLSGPVVESPSFPELIKQVGGFIDRLKPTHQLTVSLFDGRDELRTVLEPDETDTDKALSRMRHYRPEDRKGNLNGAVIKSLAIIDGQLAASKASKKLSNLVVFSDRGDMAQKVPGDELDVALDKTPADVYVIGVGPGIKRPELGKVARTDAFYSTTLDDLPVGFDQLSKHLAEGAAGQYVLSYCSPKRKGDHELEVEIVTEKDHGKLTHKFNADGFVKGCSPKNLPSFVAAKGDKDENQADDQQDEPAPKVTTAAKREKEKAKPDDDAGEKAEAPATEAAPAEEAGGGAVAASATTGRAKKPAAKPRKQESKEDKEE